MIDNDELNECEKSWFEKMLSVDFKYYKISYIS